MLWKQNHQSNPLVLLLPLPSSKVKRERRSERNVICPFDLTRWYENFVQRGEDKKDGASLEEASKAEEEAEGSVQVPEIKPTAPDKNQAFEMFKKDKGEEANR